MQALPRVADFTTAANELWLSCVLRDLSALKYECAGPASTVRLTRPICLTLLTCSVCPRRAAWDDDQPRHSDGLERSGLYANSKRAHAGAAPRGLSSTDYVRVHVPIGVDQALPSSFIGADQSRPAAFK